MIYVRSLRLSGEGRRNPNLYPYNVFGSRRGEQMIFEPVTLLYGNNGSGKSTVLNLLANLLGIQGSEQMTYYCQSYFEKYQRECVLGFGEDEYGNPISAPPKGSRYIKSEDILYEVKKVEREAVLEEELEFQQKLQEKAGKKTLKKGSLEWMERMEILAFAQEKYSNGETAMRLFDDFLCPDALFLLDEPETSLSPANQVKLAETINQMARLLDCQFIIASHSPFLLGTLAAKIYNLDRPGLVTCPWTQLENIRYFYDFFQTHRKEFDGTRP